SILCECAAHFVPHRPARPTPFPYTTLFRSVGAVLVAASDERERADRRRLGRPHELHREVAVGLGEQDAVVVRHAETPSRGRAVRSEEHTSELQSREKLVCRLLLEKKKGSIC